MGLSSLPSFGKMPPSGDEGDMSESEYSETEQLESSTMVKEVKNDATVLVNKVLAFTWSSMQKNGIDDTTQLIIKSFKLEDIENAKAALWSHCRGNQEIIGGRKKRRGSVNRNGVLAHARDIAQALQKLDMKKKVPTIVIDALDLPSLPACSVRSVNGEMELRMSRLESICNSLQDTLMKFCKSADESKLISKMNALEAVCEHLQQTTSI